jgi:hypothetical protein
MERNNVSSPDCRPFAIGPAASSERSPNRHEVLATPDRLFWCALAKFGLRREALTIVQPETALRWERERFLVRSALE